MSVACYNGILRLLFNRRAGSLIPVVISARWLLVATIWGLGLIASALAGLRIIVTATALSGMIAAALARLLRVIAAALARLLRIGRFLLLIGIVIAATALPGLRAVVALRLVIASTLARLGPVFAIGLLQRIQANLAYQFHKAGFIFLGFIGS